MSDGEWLTVSEDITSGPPKPQPLNLPEPGAYPVADGVKLKVISFNGEWYCTEAACGPSHPDKADAVRAYLDILVGRVAALRRVLGEEGS